MEGIISKKWIEFDETSKKSFKAIGGFYKEWKIVASTNRFSLLDPWMLLDESCYYHSKAKYQGSMRTTNESLYTKMNRVLWKSWKILVKIFVVIMKSYLIIVKTVATPAIYVSYTCILLFLNTNLFAMIWMQIESVHCQILPANKTSDSKMRGLPVYCQWIRRVLTFGTFIFCCVMRCVQFSFDYRS